MDSVRISEKMDGPYKVRVVQEDEADGQRIYICVSRPNPRFDKKSTWERFLGALGVTTN